MIGTIEEGGDDMATQLIGQATSGAGAMIGGAPGMYINNLKDTSMKTTDQIVHGQYGSALNTGLIGIGEQMGNTIGGTIFNAAGQSAG